ncbi:MAG: carboxymuconolactone decarboxylase family protein [SAR324 cluster bacterium]|nr:carboxymuconolactone decarboxylase family protein [SAR324 cluster bacterium]
MNDERYEQGLKLRREMLGTDYVDRAIGSANDFNKPFQDLVTEYVWGYLWHREGLSHRERILINLAILSSTNMPNEVKLYVDIALRAGLSPDDIREVFLHTAMYSGVPRALEAFRVAGEAMAARDEGQAAPE